MQRLKPDVDIIKDILEAVLLAQPGSSFTQSLHSQYLERGGLSKKQLQGLFEKAKKISSIPPGKLATLEAIILRKHSKHRSELPAGNLPLYSKDEFTGKKIQEILEKYPSHKQVLILRSKYENNELLSNTELNELEKFYRILVARK